MVWQVGGGIALLVIGIALVFWGGRKTVSEAQRKEAARSKKLMEELIATDGWKELMKIASEQQRARTNQVLLTPTNEPLIQEYVKGEIHGIRLFSEIPEKVISGSEAILEAFAKENEE